MSRRSVLLLCYLGLLGGCSIDARLSEEEEERTRDAVAQSFEGLIAASRSFDFDRYLGFFDVRFSGLNQDGTVTHTIDEFDQTYRGSFAIPVAYESLDFSRVKITVIDRNTAILVNEFEAEVLLPSGDVVSTSGGGAQTWSKASGEWKVVSVSSARKPAGR